MTLVTCSGILLRSYDYSDSSRIFRFLTAERGLVSVIGKGVRKRSAQGDAAIQTLSEGSLTFHFRPDRELHPLRDFQSREGSLSLGRDVRRFAGASLVAELILAHKLEESDPALYEWFRHVLQQLAEADAADIPGWILAGGWGTLAHLGYPPELSQCVCCGRELEDPADTGAVDEEAAETHRFDISAGGLICARCAVATKGGLPRVGPGARSDLLRLVEGDPPNGVRGVSAHLSLLEAFALHHLAPRNALRSFAVLRPLLNHRHAEGYKAD